MNQMYDELELLSTDLLTSLSQRLLPEKNSLENRSMVEKINASSDSIEVKDVRVRSLSKRVIVQELTRSKR